MTYNELQVAFELEINQLDSNLTKPTTSDMEYWLMAGLDKFIKTRYSGINFKRRGFEQDQKEALSNEHPLNRLDLVWQTLLPRSRVKEDLPRLSALPKRGASEGFTPDLHPHQWTGLPANRRGEVF